MELDKYDRILIDALLENGGAAFARDSVRIPASCSLLPRGRFLVHLLLGPAQLRLNVRAARHNETKRCCRDERTDVVTLGEPGGAQACVDRRGVDRRMCTTVADGSSD